MPTMAKKKNKKKTNTRGQYHAKTMTIGDPEQNILDQIRKDLQSDVGGNIAYPDSMIVRCLIQFYQTLKKNSRVEARDILG